MERKYLVSELRRCERCRLLFRYPVDSEEESHAFYQVDYSDGFATDCPGEGDLQRLLASEFRGHEKDYSAFVTVLRSLRLPAGPASWTTAAAGAMGPGNCSAGFHVYGFEISRPRARYARDKLGLPVTSDAQDLPTGVDCFFSAHVLEHVPAVGNVLELARRVVRPGGLFVAFTPNGSTAYRNRQPQRFHTAWGKFHPNFLSDDFYATLLADKPYLLASSPYDPQAIAGWNQQKQQRLDLSGGELLCAAILGQGIVLGNGQEKA